MEYGIVGFLLTGFAAIAAAIGAYTRAQQRIWPRRLRALRRTFIRDLKPGVVKLVGKIQPLAPLSAAPFSRRPCAAHQVMIFEPSGEDETELHRETYTSDFLIDDGTGVVLVRAADTKLVLHVDQTFTSGMLTDPQPRIRAYLQERRIETEGLFFSRSLRCTEGVLEAGETVVVCGHAREEADPDPRRVTHYRETPRRFVIQGESAKPMFVSDEPRLVKIGRGLRSSGPDDPDWT